MGTGRLDSIWDKGGQAAEWATLGGDRTSLCLTLLICEMGWT